MKLYVPLPYLRDPWWLEVFSSIMALTWAAGSYFLDGHIGNPEAYRLAMQIFSHTTWEQVGALLAVLQILGCFMKSRNYRVITAFFMSGFWLVLGYTIHIAEPDTLGVAFYAVWGIANMVAMSLLARPEAHD